MIDYDALAEDYARHRTVHPEVLRGIVSNSRIGGTSRVLEVGCGTGSYLIALREHIGCSCWGVDPAKKMLAEARKRDRDIAWSVGKGESLDFQQDSFDFVFTVDVIHHMDDYREYLHEAYRVLRPGARLCTVTESEWQIRNRQPLARHFPETVNADLRRYPRVNKLRGYMERVGFHEITQERARCTFDLTDIEMYRDKAFSSLQMISDEAFHQGIERMEADLRNGPIPCTPHYMLVWGTK